MDTCDGALEAESQEKKMKRMYPLLTWKGGKKMASFGSAFGEKDKKREE